MQLISLEFGLGDPFHGHLTAIKTRYPLISITWPYRGLRYRTHRGHDARASSFLEPTFPLSSVQETMTLGAEWKDHGLWENEIGPKGWKNAEVSTLNLPFNVKTESVTFALTKVKTLYEKLFIFTLPTQGYWGKQCFVCWSKSHLSQSTWRYFSRFAFTKSWSHLPFCF